MGSEERICWFILGKPPGQKKILIINGVKPEKAHTDEEAVREGIKDLPGNFSTWSLAAISLDGRHIDFLRRDLGAVFEKFGVPREKVEDLIQEFAAKMFGTMKKSFINRHLRS